MKKIKLFVLLLLPVFSLGQTVSLDSCYAWARSNSPKANSLVIQKEIAEIRKRNLAANFLPKLGLNAQAHYQSDVSHIEGGLPLPSGTVSFPTPPLQQFKVTVDVQQTIYDGGITSAAKVLEEQNLMSANSELEVNLFARNKQVNSFFFALLVLAKQQEQLAVMRDNLQQTLKMVASRVKNGVLPKGSEDEIELSLLQLQQQNNSLQNNAEAMRKMLGVMTGKSIGSATVLQVPEVELQSAMSRPELKLFEAKKKYLEQLQVITKKENRPKVSAFAQLGYGNPGLNMMQDEWSEFYLIGARLHWNIYDWGTRKRQRKELQLQQVKVENSQNAFLQQIEVAKTKHKLRQHELKITIEQDGKMIDLHKKIRKRSQSKLANGVLTSAEYVQKLSDETKAMVQREIHKLELLRSVVEMNTLNGNL